MSFILLMSSLMRKSPLSEKIKRLVHKFSRFTKQQKVFVLYLFALIFFLIVLPIIRIAPVDTAGHSIWLFNIHLFKTLLIVLICLIVLVAWNISFRFKNFVIGYFGFKENDALINFWFLFLIATSFLSMGDTINVVGTATQTIKVTWAYYFIQIFLLLGLVLTLLSVIKHAKEHGNKTKIVNVVDEEAIREVHNKQSLKWLFEEEEEPKHAEHHAEHHHTEHHHTEHHAEHHEEENE